MATRRSKKPADVNRRAAAVVAEATSEEPVDPYKGKDPAAVELGRKGGQKGGRVRAEKLTPAQRSAIARNAAQARWKHADQAAVAKGSESSRGSRA